MRKVRRALEIVWEGRRWEDVKSQQEEKQHEGARWVAAVLFYLPEKLR